MKLRFALAVGYMTVLCGASVSSAETGDLKIRFEYDASPVPPQPINVGNQAFCSEHPLTNEKLLVNPKNKGIRSVVVYVYTGRGGSELPEFDPLNNTHELANDKCRFEPHIVISQTGDTLKVTNPDDVGHNANLSFLRNNPQNFTIPPKQEKSVKLKVAEPAPIPVDCNIHPWMRSYVVVLDHPFAAKSDENGELTIKRLPAGEKLVFRVFHEAGSIDDVIVDGKNESWGRSRFEVKIKPGMNDMGTVLVPAKSLKAN